MTISSKLPDKVQKLLRDYDSIVDGVELHGEEPRVYLVGENHTEVKHSDFTSDLVKILSPKILFAEFADSDYCPEKQHFTFAGILKSHDVGYMRDYFVQILKDSDNPYKEDPNSFLDKRSYDFTDSDFELLEELVSNAIINRTNNRRQELLNRIDLLEKIYLDGDASFEEVNNTQSLFLDIHSILSIADYEEALEWMKKTPSKMSKHLLSVESYNLFRVMGYIKDTVKDYVDSLLKSQEYGPELRSQFSSISKIEDTCRNVGAQISVFDDNEAKNDNGSDSNMKREAEMSRILAEYIDNNSGVVITYTGRNHVRPDSPVLKTLQERNVSYFVVRLDIDTPCPELRSLKSLLYSEFLRENGS